LDAGECGFEDRILAECRRHIDHGSIGAGRGNCVGNGVEHRQTEVFGAALARRYTADHFGAVCNRLLRVQGALRAGEALADYLGVLVDQYAHFKPSAAALTTAWAASVKLLAAMMLRPLSASNLVPRSALLPSRRTTTGTFTPTCSTAPMMPSAIRLQRTIPPKMLTRTAFTLSSDRMILNASETRSLVAPPPTSRKLAGAPPCSCTMSMVPMARPAPLSMQPLWPSRAT